MIINNFTLLHMTDFDGELHQDRFFYCNNNPMTFGNSMFFTYLLYMGKRKQKFE